MTAEDTLVNKIAFASYRNITRTTGAQLIARGVSPDTFFEREPFSLAALTGLKPDVFSEERRRRALDEARREASFVTEHGIKAIFFTDDGYPRRLAECEDAPAMIYTLGTADLDACHVVAVVGTRHSTAYGLDFTSRLIKDLAESLDNVLVISGLAYGIDYAAHTAALREGLPTAAVFAHGLNTVYPADHRQTAMRMVREGGALITEYRSCDPIHRAQFLARNRIVAGLSDAVVVVESDRKGGAMSTAHLAMAYNREVFALPGRVSDLYSRGCNDLIAGKGAVLVRDASDIIEACGWTPRPTVGTQQELPIEIDADRRRIIDFIRKCPDATVNDMCSALGIPFARLSSLMFEMEMEDLLVSLPGGKYGIVAAV